VGSFAVLPRLERLLELGAHGIATAGAPLLSIDFQVRHRPVPDDDLVDVGLVQLVELRLRLGGGIGEQPRARIRPRVLDVGLVDRDRLRGAGEGEDHRGEAVGELRGLGREVRPLHGLRLPVAGAGEVVALGAVGEEVVLHAAERGAQVVAVVQQHRQALLVLRRLGGDPDPGKDARGAAEQPGAVAVMMRR